MACRVWDSHNKVSDCSVKHVGSLSYTEDDILIYTLYVSPLKKSDENRLKEYFSKFGEVEKVNIITRKNRTSNSFRSYSFAFVKFKEAESASKALKFKMHFLSNRSLIVRSADSWKQPFQKKLIKTEDECLDNEKSNANYSILNLNDDCLFMIFKYLSFNEQVKMSTLCTRLEYIFELLYKTTKSINIDLAESLTLMDFRQGLQKMGRHIENITFNSGLSMKNFTRFIDFVSKFCPNLCKLQLDSLHFKYNEIFHKIASKLQTINHLKLKNCSINDDMTKYLSNIHTIEYLDLSDNYEITGIHLEKFENLRTLILSSCANIQPSQFIKMCTKATKIKELNIRRCDRLSTSAIQAIVDNLTELETLTICTSYQTNELERITELKSLKHLTINQSSNKTEPLFNKLAEEKKDKLETLKITNFSFCDSKANAIKELIKLKQLDLPFATCCSDKYIKDISKLQNLKILNIPGVILDKDCLLKYLSKCPNIEFIDISRVPDYDDEFIKNVIEILNKQYRSQPLTLRVGLTGVSTDIMEQSFVKDNKNILKIDTTLTDYVMEMVDPNFDLLSDYEDDDDDLDFDDDISGVDDTDSDDNYDYDTDSYMNAWDELDDGNISPLNFYIFFSDTM